MLRRSGPTSSRRPTGETPATAGLCPSTLRQAVESHFEGPLERDFEDLRYRYHEAHEEARSRIDERSYILAQAPTEGAVWEGWPSVKAIGDALRGTQADDGSETVESSHDIASRSLSDAPFGEVVSGHWNIASLHWALDVSFREDDGRTRERTRGNRRAGGRDSGVAAEATSGQRQPAGQEAPRQWLVDLGP